MKEGNANEAPHVLTAFNLLFFLGVVFQPPHPQLCYPSYLFCPNTRNDKNTAAHTMILITLIAEKRKKKHVEEGEGFNGGAFTQAHLLK